MTDLRFNQAALKALEDGVAVQRFVAQIGDQVADRANARAAKLFKDDGGGGVGGVTSRIETDERGPFARIGYGPEHFYMMIGELGSERQKPRPHLRPALFATRKATGGTDSGIRRISQNKQAQKRTTRNRALAKARRSAG